ncbi:hypothetical protein RB195_019897 [Necator americanus]|uniref:Uncharacterized protein n=1 Tax=Necator americanus TaxID=51031 RepID=A0ABR1CG95_NECAM
MKDVLAVGRLQAGSTSSRERTGDVVVTGPPFNRQQPPTKTDLYPTGWNRATLTLIKRLALFPDCHY